MSLKLACSSTLLLLLANHLQSGEGLKCYESSCLKDHGQKSLQCYEESVSSMTLEDCTSSSFTQRWSDVTKEMPTTEQMKCVKLAGLGKLPKAHTKMDVIRTCVPMTQDMCDVLSTLVSTRIEHSEVMDLRLNFDCDICETDGCNSAPSRTLPPLAVFVTVGLALLVAL